MTLQRRIALKIAWTMTLMLLLLLLSEVRFDFVYQTF